MGKLKEATNEDLDKMKTILEYKHTDIKVVEAKLAELTTQQEEAQKALTTQSSELSTKDQELQANGTWAALMPQTTGACTARLCVCLCPLCERLIVLDMLMLSGKELEAIKVELTGKQDEVAAVHTQLAHMKQEHDLKTQELFGLGLDTASKQDEVAALEQTLSDRKQQLEQDDAKLQQSEAAFKESEAQLKEARISAETVAAKLTEDTQKCEEATKALDAVSKEVEALKNELDDKAKEVGLSVCEWLCCPCLHCSLGNLSVVALSVLYSVPDVFSSPFSAIQFSTPLTVFNLNALSSLSA